MGGTTTCGGYAVCGPILRANPANLG